MNYHKVAVGGTFDCFHKGHEALLRKAFEVGSRVIVGITSDEFVAEKHISRMSHIRPMSLIRRIGLMRYSARKRAVAAYIAQQGWRNCCTILEITDHYGPTVDDPGFDAIVVSPETEKFAVEINEKRAAKGHSPLIITVVPWVLADDGKAIAATRIRNGEIGPEGEVFSLPADWGVRRMPDDVREKLKKPFGKYFTGDRISYAVYRENTKKSSPDILYTNPDILLISVGDKITQSLLQVGIMPQIAIIDYHIQRKKEFKHFTQHGFDHDVAVTEVKNAAGTVSYEGFAAIRRIAAHAYTSYESYKTHKTHTTYTTHVVVVDGEEDLMVLPAVLSAPLGAVIVYGQPGYQSVPGKPPIDGQKQGVVVVEVTVGKKREVMEILSEFKKS